MVTVSNLDDLNTWHEKASEKIRLASKIVTPADYPSPYLFHISKNPKIEEFIPVIGRRQMEMEDRTVPRVCVCPYLIGCMIGYTDIEKDFFLNRRVDQAKSKAPFLGGWKIYAFEYEAAIKPTSKLVEDSRRSDECWLTTYNEATQVYQGKIVGEMFYTTMTYRARNLEEVGSHGLPEAEGVMYLRTDVMMPFSKQNLLEPGCYRIEGVSPERVRSYLDDKLYEVSPVSEAEYLKAKHGVADMLAYQAPDPIFLNWN